MVPSELFERPGSLLITAPAPAHGSNAPPALFLAMLDDGTILACNGHVDLGTGIGTALAQIVAEELDVGFERVTMVLGDTARTPDQGPTIASETIQVAAIPLRQAAAQARGLLLQEAARRLGVPLASLATEDGAVRAGEQRLSYADLLAGRTLHAALDPAVTVKSPAAYQLVGQSVPRADIPAKAVGAFQYVHDLRLPGMLHGRVVRPPYLGHDSGDFVGRSLLAVDDSALASIEGIVAVVTAGDFVGVVASREENAVRAMQALLVTWRPFAPDVDLSDVDRALRRHPSTRRVLLEQGDLDAALAGAAKRLERSYSWPYQMHGSIGPSCAVADHAPGRLTVWSGTQDPHGLRADLARLLAMPEQEIEIVRMEAAGCYGRNCADDVAGDAALLARAVGRPVRVQLTREQEHAWEPKGAAQLCDVVGGIDAAGHPVGYGFTTRYPSNMAPMLPLLLTGIVPPEPATVPMGDRTAIPPYAYPAMRIAVEDMPPLVRAAWLRGVSALPNSFAHECFIDEMAAEAGVDPVEYRLRYLKDPRAAELVRRVAARANWRPRSGPRQAASGDVLRGQGFAYALYTHGAFPGTPAAYAAWVADVAVDRSSGAVSVERVTVGHDAGLMINPAGVAAQVHGNVIQSTSRTLLERVRFDERALVASREWGGYPIMTFHDVPEIDLLLIERPGEPPLGVGESASVPSAAAIANAIFDATGVRFRSVPFTPEVILAGLGAPPPPAKKRSRFWLGALAGLGAGLAASLGWPRALPAAAPPGPGVFAASLIERGRVLAAAGNCAACHTAPGGTPFAGGRRIATPFGSIVGSNLTPDLETGIGSYSLAAFQRAMRDGIARDGRHLYPAFPYPHFSRLDDADLVALYAYLMRLAPVVSPTPPTRLAFPFNLRPLLALWNALFHRPSPLLPDATRSAAWNRGRYLVEALGHCGACHTPRNAFGAERGGAALHGAFVDGWEAPALTERSPAPILWSRAALFDYLRTGHSALHGAAAGSMAAVVEGLAALPDADIRAIAEYLAPAAVGDDTARAAALEAAAWARVRADTSPAARLFAGACGACHHDGSGPEVFGRDVRLSLTTALHSARPDNVLRVILEGANAMPAFGDSLSDTQTAELAGFLRQQFAPEQPAWPDLAASAARVRAATPARP